MFIIVTKGSIKLNLIEKIELATHN